MQKGADSCTSTYNRRKTTLRRQTDTTNRRTNTQRKEANWADAIKFYRKYNQCLHRNASKFCTCNNPQRSWLGHSWRANQIPGGSVQFNHSVVSNSLWSDGLWHIRLPCPSPTSRDCSNSCLLSQWCHPTISSILCRPLLLLPPIPPSIRVFSNESTQWWSLMSISKMEAKRTCSIAQMQLLLGTPEISKTGYEVSWKARYSRWKYLEKALKL